MNPSFDVTPVDLVTSLVLDRGVFSRDALRGGALRSMTAVAATRTTPGEVC